MKEIMIKLSVLIMAIVFLLVFLNGCSLVNEADSSTTDEQKAIEPDPTNEEIIYQIVYKYINFVSDDEKIDWRDNLTDLIENPEKSEIEKGMRLGLFDINIDGTPELLVDMGGGSAGNAFYMVYDIETGKYLDSLNGGFEDSWCIYFNRESGEFETIGQYRWREGRDIRQSFINKATILTNETGETKINEQEYIYTYYSIDDISSSGTYRARFKINGSAVSLDDYLTEYSYFVQNYIRIPETGLKLIGWNDDKTAEELVDLLLSTEQKFIISGKKD